MTSIINKIKDKVGPNDSKSGTNNTSPKGGSPDRSIPPEPVQQNPHGDFSADDAAPAMQVHNLARANKGCNKLEWSAELAEDAKKYAKTLAEKQKMEHSRVEGQGENLYMSSGDAEFDQAVQSWLGEEKQYNGEKVGDGNISKWGHFSQCLWDKTTHVGMGKATASNGATYIVARYSPPGNLLGQKPF